MENIITTWSTLFFLFSFSHLLSEALALHKNISSEQRTGIIATCKFLSVFCIALIVNSGTSVNNNKVLNGLFLGLVAVAAHFPKWIRYSYFTLVVLLAIAFFFIQETPQKKIFFFLEFTPLILTFYIDSPIGQLIWVKIQEFKEWLKKYPYRKYIELCVVFFSYLASLLVIPKIIEKLIG